MPRSIEKPAYALGTITGGSSIINCWLMKILYTISGGSELGKQTSFYGWKLAGVLWLLYLVNMGFAFYGGFVANSYMLKDVPMDRTAFGFGVTLMVLAVGLPSPLIAASINKLGVKWTLLLGSSLIAIGSMIMSIATSVWHYYAGFGIFIGVGVGFSTVVPISTLVTRWFSKYRGKAMAFVMTAAGFGGFIGSTAIAKILQLNGGNWHQVWFIVACISVSSGVLSFFFVKERPEDIGQVPDGIVVDKNNGQPSKANPLVTTYNWTTSEAYRSKAFWLIILAGHATFYPLYFVTAHWILHLKGLGMTVQDAAFGMATFTLLTMAGKMLGGIFMDKMQARYVFAIGIAITAVGSFIGISADSMFIALLASGLLGTGFGWTFVTSSTIIGNYFGAGIFPTMFGIFYLIVNLTCSWAGTISGRIFDYTKSYTMALGIDIAICIIGIIAILAAVPPRGKNEVVK